MCTIILKKIKSEMAQILLNNMLKNNSFNTGLCTAMISVNIPFSKLLNANFLSKYTSQNIPEKSTKQKNYVGVSYNNTINSIRAYVENKKLSNKQ